MPARTARSCMSGVRRHGRSPGMLHRSSLWSRVLGSTAPVKVAWQRGTGACAVISMHSWLGGAAAAARILRRRLHSLWCGFGRPLLGCFMAKGTLCRHPAAWRRRVQQRGRATAGTAQRVFWGGLSKLGKRGQPRLQTSAARDNQRSAGGGAGDGGGGGGGACGGRVVVGCRPAACRAVNKRCGRAKGPRQR